MRKFLIIFVIVMLSASLPEFRTAAQACSYVDWRERRSRHFAFIFEAGPTPGRDLAGQLSETLDTEYERFSAIFETEFQQPVSIRVYPSLANYFCLNALAPEIPAGQFHSRVGGREIALIAEHIEMRPDAWQLEALDSLRFELAALFARQVSGGKAPIGLENGLGAYAQDPFIMFERHLAGSDLSPEAPEESWRGLWNSPDPHLALGHAVQAASITAYLVDVYGWETWLSFLQALRTSEGWRQALAETYPASPGELENTWSVSFYPLFMADRWRFNALYNYSLTPYEGLIAAGAYQAAIDGLAPVIDLLAALEDAERLSRARELNVRALNGLTAESQARQSRQAYLQGEFENALLFAGQAQAIYADLGDTRNAEALAVYAGQSREVLDLRAELADIESDFGLLGGFLHAERLVEIGARLEALGDPTGRNRTAFLLERINQQQRSQGLFFAIAGGSLALLLLVHRIKLARAGRPEEVLLQG